LLDHNEIRSSSVIQRPLASSAGVQMARENFSGQATTRSMSTPIGPV
jgi:hypothetical protein